MTIDWSKMENISESSLKKWRKNRTISRIEIADNLLALGFLDEDQAEELTGHNLPEPLNDLTNNLPDGIRQKARRVIRGASQFDRTHPMWEFAPNPPYDETTIDLIFGYDENEIESDPE